jgi:hypothetical protein
MTEFRTTETGGMEVMWAGAWSSVPKPAADEIVRLRAEVELWKDRHDAAVQAAQQMEQHFDEMWQHERHG